MKIKMVTNNVSIFYWIGCIILHELYNNRKIISLVTTFFNYFTSHTTDMVDWLWLVHNKTCVCSRLRKKWCSSNYNRSYQQLWKILCLWRYS